MLNPYHNRRIGKICIEGRKHRVPPHFSQFLADKLKLKKREQTRKLLNMNLNRFKLHRKKKKCRVSSLHNCLPHNPLDRKIRLLIRRSPPRTRRSSASSVGSCAGTMQQSAKSVPSNRSRSPTPHHHPGGKQQASSDEQRKTNRSRSPTPQRKFLGSPVHQPDLGKQRSRSPTPKAVQLRSSSPTAKVEKGGSGTVDSAGRSLYEEARSPTHHHGRHQEAKVGW